MGRDSSDRHGDCDDNQAFDFFELVIVNAIAAPDLCLGRAGLAKGDWSMNAKLLLCVSSIVVATGCLAGCGEGPDLVASPRLEVATSTDAFRFCALDDAGRLIITVKNRGNRVAGASVTRVEFHWENATNNVIFRDTPALDPGESVEFDPIEMNYPDCWSPDCYFTITVDTNNDVQEFPEGTIDGTPLNAADGYCLG